MRTANKYSLRVFATPVGGGIFAAVLATTLSGSLLLNYSDKDAVPATAAHAVVEVPATIDHSIAAKAISPDGKQGDPQAKNFVEVNWKVRGNCRAASQAADSHALGGFAPSDNTARIVSAVQAGRGLYLFAEPEIITQFGTHTGMRVALVNRTDQLLAFRACDSRIRIVQEALDEDAVWKPIEYLPSSWCGNSYHRVFLAPNHFWEFAAPRYTGSFPTQLRFAMTLEDQSVIYSDAFEGSINFEQFTETREYIPGGLMDPYLD